MIGGRENQTVARMSEIFWKGRDENRNAWRGKARSTKTRGSDEESEDAEVAKSSARSLGPGKQGVLPSSRGKVRVQGWK
jgi:hypothetical protein